MVFLKRAEVSEAQENANYKFRKVKVKVSTKITSKKGVAVCMHL